MPSEPGVPESRCPQCGQFLPNSDERKRRRFRWGIVLAVLTFLPFAWAMFMAFRTISAARTTGLGAVAGGGSEFLVMFGGVALVCASVASINLLARGLSTAHPARMAISILGIAWSGFMLLLTAGGFVLTLIGWEVAIRG